MTREDELLRAIRDNPEDDALRRVYADWLEEQGRHERGELIRLQLELTRHDLPRERRQELETRQTALMTGHDAAWLGLLPPYLGYKYFPRGWYFTRGMPHVALRPRAFLGKKFQALAADWFPRAGIQAASLHGSTARLEEIGNSPLLRELHTLEFHDVCARDDAVAAFAGSPNLSSLHTLWMGQTSMKAEGVRALVNSPHLGRLRHLGLAGNGGIGLGVPDLIGSPLWPQLTGLSLGGAGIGPRQFLTLLEALPRTRLKRLALGLNGIGDSACAALAACPAAATLQVLDLGFCRIGLAGVVALAGSPHLAGLRELSLRRADLTEEGAAALANSPHLGGLVRLDVCHCPIPARGLEVLKARFGDALLYDQERVD